jgi:asparagine synthase (glutamine-hydrolysing)
VTAVFDDGTDRAGEQAPVARDYGFDSHVVPGDAAWTFAVEGPPSACDEPLEGMYTVTLRRLLDCAAAQGVDVLLTGYAGDLVLGGTYYYLFELLTDRKWSAWLHELRCHPARSRPRLLFKYVLGPAALRRPARTRYAVPTWIAPSFSRRLGLRERARPDAGFESGMGVARQAEADGLGLVHHATRMLWQHGEAEALGVELRHPFLDRRLFEFLLAVPPARKVRHGRAKTLLREMMETAPAGPGLSRLPSHQPSRVFNRRVREREQRDWNVCFADSVAARSGYIDPYVLQGAFARYLDGDTRLKYALARTFRLEAWLKRLRGRSCLRIEAGTSKEGASHVGSATPGDSKDTASPPTVDEARQAG